MGMMCDAGFSHRQLVADDVQAASKAVQKLVAVPKDHLHTIRVPERVLVSVGEMNTADDMHVLVVDALPVELREVKVQDPPDVIVRVVRRVVPAGLLSFHPDNLAGQVVLIRIVLRIIHGAVEPSGRRGLWRGLGLRCRGYRSFVLFLLGNQRFLVL